MNRKKSDWPPKKPVTVILLMLAIATGSCQIRDNQPQSTVAHHNQSVVNADTLACCSGNLPDRFAVVAGDPAFSTEGSEKLLPDENMVFIPGGRFTMGGDSFWGRADEFPLHEVEVSSFYMDRHEVTNAEFDEFVKATGYVTTAERKPDWEEMKKQLPPGTMPPPDSVLVAASLVFSPPAYPVALNNAAAWWKWVAGANWRHPQGPGTSVSGKENHPVVHVSWEDAMAYAIWAGKRLPTEAEWEYAARGGLAGAIYPWGNQPIDQGGVKANSWQGHFPDKNTERDKYYRTAPVMSFTPNGYGLYDMAGNVWEWCSDWYRADYFEVCDRTGLVTDPKGPSDSYDPDEPFSQKRVVRGGSFLCTDQYCSGFRVSARMKTSWDTGLDHTGFRCVVSVR